MQPDITRFLTHDFPQLLATARFKEPVRLQLLVPGHRNLRTHYELNADRVSWSEGLSDQGSQVTLAIQMPELEAWVNGTLDVHEALILGRIQVFGEELAAKALGSMLSTNGLWSAET